VELTNEERAKQGLSPLKADAQLSKVARDKSKDMATNGYFSHNSPTYGSPFDMMKQYGITYRTAGENIAKGQRTPQEVDNGWMNSEGVRANILNGVVTHIGGGEAEQGTHWAQQSIGKEWTSKRGSPKQLLRLPLLLKGRVSYTYYSYFPMQ